MYDAYLKLDGVEGEATASEFEGWIEIDSFSLGASNPANIGSGGEGIGAGKVNVSSFNVAKKTDAASPVIFQACCKGDHFPNAEVTLRKSGGSQMEFIKFTFDKVYVEDIQWSGASQADDVPMENLSLAFGKVVVTYTKQTAEGDPAGSIEASWNLQTVSPD